MKNDSYDRTTIRYHWLVAGLIATLWILGQCIDFFPKGDLRVYARSVHITLGAVTAVTFLLRLRWRHTQGLRLPAADPGMAGKLAIGVHHLLYLIIALVILAGLSAAWVRGDNLYNLFHIPAFDPTHPEWRETIVDIHGFLANSLLALAGLHALAALRHHFLKKDQVLQRMWPTLGRR